MRVPVGRIRLSAARVSYTYNGDPADSPVNAVRFLCGDTDMAHPILHDEEIAYIVGTQRNARQAALAACYAMLRKLAPRPDETVGPVSVRNSAVIANIKASIASIKYEIAVSAAFPWAGGISVSDKQANNGGDVVQPVFRKRMLQPAFNEGDGYDDNSNVADDPDVPEGGPEE